MAHPFVFRRPGLAKRMADVSIGVDPLGGSSGLFLAAPRRTGKSTFLTVDLVPELSGRGAIAISVDLWSDLARDPADLVLDVVRGALRDLESGMTKAARRSGLAKVGVGSWQSIDIDKAGTPGGPTIPRPWGNSAGAMTGRSSW